MVAAALAIVYVVWGSTYLGMKFAGETIPPLLMLSARCLIAGVILYAASARPGRAGHERPGPRAWVDSAIVAGGLLLGGLGLVAIGVQHVPTGVAAVIIATAPLWMALFDRAFFGVRLTRPTVAGLAVGFAGVALLVWPSGAHGFDRRGLVLILVSPVLWSAGTIYAKRRARLPAQPFVATSLEMLTGGALLAAAGLARGEGGHLHLTAISERSLIAFAYLVVIGSLIAFSSYVWLLTVAPISLISTYAYVNPIVALALGVLLDGESLTMRTLLAAGVILAGVALIVSAHARRVSAP